ncbi:VWA domain-containing protein [Microbacterium sp. NEAU-LLC]|uniref:VWA domain-containing protein n=1 Tax=Microbacterium helvum TaxID=2773713 RepID=A0ABR8NHS9_9MICO|nr:VWA domain-containing protein [Microbacterium helvum]MBD3940263.1 VWA domain-containing protein [Microbacterium helvum]
MSSPRTATAPAHAVLEGPAREAWVRAQDLWGVHMGDAQLLPGAGAERGAAAWFTFPPAIAVDPAMLHELGADGELESVFAHELGHHALAPSTRIDQLKIRHQLARALVAAGVKTLREDDVSLLSNLWTDLLVNTRVALLQRRRDAARGVGATGGEAGIIRTSRLMYRGGHETTRPLWWVYLRAYELLWNLPAGELCALTAPAVAVAPQAPSESEAARERPLDQVPERFREREAALREARRAAERVAAELEAAVTTHPAVDADDVARLVRAFASDAVSGALRFGVIMAPYVVAEERARQRTSAGAGSARVGAGGAGSPGGSSRPGGSGLPGGAGACAADSAPATPDELGRVLADRRLHGEVPSRVQAGDPGAAGGTAPSDADAAAEGGGQGFGVAQTLALYEGSDAAAVLAAWYRAEAARWVRPFTQRSPALPVAELPGPLEAWGVGDDLADLDWSATLQAAPVVVPGVTTRRRSYLDDEPTPTETGIELDLYIDSSGSMPHPSRGSAAVLAGTILALSVLRGGGRVRVTSFSGPGQAAGSDGFSRDHVRIVGDLALYFGGGTSFPLDLLARRYDPLPAVSGPEGASDPGIRRHLVVLSDDGLTSMFGVGNEPYADVAARVRSKLTTGSLVVLDSARRVEALATAAGYAMLYVTKMDDAPAACARLAEVLHG